MSNRQDDALPLDRAVDWDINGQPITYRDCIRSQCGPMALTYAERIQELAIASLQARLDAAERWLLRQDEAIDVIRVALELIALGEAEDPKFDAEQALVKAGMWDAK